VIPRTQIHSSKEKDLLAEGTIKIVHKRKTSSLNFKGRTQRYLGCYQFKWDLFCHIVFLSPQVSSGSGKGRNREVTLPLTFPSYRLLPARAEGKKNWTSIKSKVFICISNRTFSQKKSRFLPCSYCKLFIMYSNRIIVSLQSFHIRLGKIASINKM
jgi:hypothetical protein